MSHHNLITLNDNVLAAIDVETTGRDPAYNEVCQVAVVVLDCHLNPVNQFYTNIRPLHPHRMHPEATAAHGLSLEVLNQAPGPYEVADMMWEWSRSLELAPGKRIIPLVHNASFDIPFLQQWLGYELFYDIFGYPVRDTQALVSALMDKAAFNCVKIPFNRANLGTCCETLGVTLDGAHDSLADALATARVYRTLMTQVNW